MDWYANRMQASIAINNIEPNKDHYLSDNGTIVTKFSEKDLFSIHINPEDAEFLVEWAQSIYDTFVANGYQDRMRTYGMFSTAGNSMVRVALKMVDADATVEDVTSQVISLGKSNNVSVGEVTDTVVREAIHEALENARNSND